MPASTSELNPPHLPITRTGRIHPFQVIPATPTPLFVSAPMIPETRVPCHELSEVSVQLLELELVSSVVTQSPGSEGSASRALLSFAVKNVSSGSPETKS